jgi:hypothetical protein
MSGDSSSLEQTGWGFNAFQAAETPSSSVSTGNPGKRKLQTDQLGQEKRLRVDHPPNSIPVYDKPSCSDYLMGGCQGGFNSCYRKDCCHHGKTVTHTQSPSASASHVTGNPGKRRRHLLPTDLGKNHGGYQGFWETCQKCDELWGWLDDGLRHNGIPLWDEVGECACHVYPVSPGNHEWNEVTHPLKKSGLEPVAVWRVQNPTALTKFKHLQAVDTQRGTLNVEKLYHVPGPPDITHLLVEGLDQRLALRGRFGRGIYFSPDPLKSDFYWKGGKNPGTTRMMLQVGVLVGRKLTYKPGTVDSTLRCEPKGYDSVEGCISGQTENVIYRNDRAVIQYVIEYKSRDSGASCGFGVPVVPDVLNVVIPGSFGTDVSSASGSFGLSTVPNISNAPKISNVSDISTEAKGSKGSKGSIPKPIPKHWNPDFVEQDPRNIRKHLKDKISSEEIEKLLSYRRKRRNVASAQQARKKKDEHIHNLQIKIAGFKKKNKNLRQSIREIERMLHP